MRRNFSAIVGAEWMKEETIIVSLDFALQRQKKLKELLSRY